MPLPCGSRAIKCPAIRQIYVFYLASDDGSRLYLNDKLVINHDGLHGMDEKSVQVDLEAGRTAITLTYFDNGGGDGLQLTWSGPGFQKQKIEAKLTQSLVRAILYTIKPFLHCHRCQVMKQKNLVILLRSLTLARIARQLFQC